MSAESGTVRRRPDMTTTLQGGGSPRGWRTTGGPEAGTQVSPFDDRGPKRSARWTVRSNPGANMCSLYEAEATRLVPTAWSPSRISPGPGPRQSPAGAPSSPTGPHRQPPPRPSSPRRCSQLTPCPRGTSARCPSPLHSPSRRRRRSAARSRRAAAPWERYSDLAPSGAVLMSTVSDFVRLTVQRKCPFGWSLMVDDAAPWCPGGPPARTYLLMVLREMPSSRAVARIESPCSRAC